MKHASRGTYTLHSLYLLLWANFGAFCMALLTQPDSDDKIHGKLISDWISVRHYCVSQLRTLWMHMRNNLNLSEEERTFFVMRAMKKFYEVQYYLHVSCLLHQQCSRERCVDQGYKILSIFSHRHVRVHTQGFPKLANSCSHFSKILTTTA